MQADGRAAHNTCSVRYAEGSASATAIQGIALRHEPAAWTTVRGDDAVSGDGEDFETVSSSFHYAGHLVNADSNAWQMMRDGQVAL